MLIILTKTITVLVRKSPILIAQYKLLRPRIIRSNDGTPRSVSVLAGLTVLHVLTSVRSAAIYAAFASVGSRADFQ